MKKALLSCILLLSLALAGRSQDPFTLTPSNLPQMGNSWAAWGDFDRDGDLDLALAGETNTNGAVTKLFRNDSGSFVEVPSELPGVHYPSLDWGDFDSDGDLDLLICGQDSLGNAITKILRNKNDGLTVTSIDLPGIYDGRACWGDFDNDNDPDILLSGVTSTGEYISRILRNDNGGSLFTDINATLTGFQTASACWVDYNNDGQLDACLSGDSGGGIMTKLYRNQGGTFTEVPFTFFGLAAGQVQWADLDNDGDKDLLESGMDQNIDGHIILYRNDGNDQFTRLDILENNLINTSSAIADYDNDGWPDILVMGKIPGCGGTAATVLYHNEWFMNFFQVATDVPGFKNGSVQFGDYNNDGYSDLIMTGYNGYDAYQTEIYGNTGGSGLYASNTPPSGPSGLIAAVSGYSAILSWDRPTDAETPSEGLSYNLFVGTTPESADIVSPMASLSTGTLTTVSAGNAGSDTTWAIAGLAPGTYFWSVQAVDNGYLASTFPEPQEFTVVYTDVGHVKGDQMGVWPNPAQDHVRIYFNQAVMEDGAIFDINGRIVQQFPVNGTSVDIDVRSLDAGCYMIRVGKSSSKFLKN